jgi:RNA-directed DNA polymerase
LSLKLTQNDSQLKQAFASLLDRACVAALLDISERKLNFILYVRKNNYKEFSIAKKSGAPRKIQAPVRGLKVIQQKLAQVLTAVYQIKSPAHGFARGKSILSNARVHQRSRFVFNLDLLDFFPSINFGRARGLFMGTPYRLNANVATILAQICCYQNALPQGAPTSPIVSNMICAKLDSQLKDLARRCQAAYTRYADDLTFSTPRKSFPKPIGHLDTVTNQIVVGTDLSKVIAQNGFQVNQNKVRLQKRGQRQQVTGLTVNEEANVKRALPNQARAMLHSWESNGIEAAEQMFRAKWDHKARRKTNPEFKKVVKGKIDFIGFVKGKDHYTHARLYWKYCQLDPKFSFKTITATQAASKNVILETLWILESEEGYGRQGTGVFFEDYGVVTCKHVLEKGTRAYHWTEPNIKYDIKVEWEDKNSDLAILSVQTKPRAQLRLERAVGTRRGDGVTLYGFPDYHLRQPPVVATGNVTGDREFDGILQFLISPIIVAGNSGGPVLDSKNRVIGIASHGPRDNAGAANQIMSVVTSIHHLPAIAGAGKII